MSLLQRLNPFSRKGVEEAKTPFGRVIGYSLNGGNGSELAMQSAAFLSCLRVLTNSASILPMKIYRYGDSKLQDNSTHSLWKVLNRKPNPYQLPSTFKAQMIAHMLVYGNYYAWLNKNEKGDVLEIIPMNPEYVTVTQDRLFDLSYHWRHPILGIDMKLSAADVLHVPGIVFCGILGEAVKNLASNIITLDVAMQQHASTFFRNNARPADVVVKTSANMKPEDAKQYAKDFEENYGGTNKFKTLLLYGGMEVDTLMQSAVDSQLIEQKKETAVNICGLMGVPPHKIGILDRATFSNIEHQGIEYVTDGMLPYLVRGEEEINLKCFGGQYQFYTKFTVDALMRGDSKTRAEVLEIKRRSGVVNADEWRALDDQAPIEGGDMYWQPVNYTKLGTVLPVKLADAAPADNQSKK